MRSDFPGGLLLPYVAEPSCVKNSTSNNRDKMVTSYVMLFFVGLTPFAFSISASFWAFFFSSSACLQFSSWALRNILTKFNSVVVTALINHHIISIGRFLLWKWMWRRELTYKSLVILNIYYGIFLSINSISSCNLFLFISLNFYESFILYN